jgi:uncharacterized membrane protein YesL
MKDKLNELAEEMLKEVKDLKDLTKKELPEVAKEYVNYFLYSNIVGLFYAVILCLLSTSSFYYLFFVVEKLSEKEQVLAVLTCIIIMPSFFLLWACTENILAAVVCPKRKAIEGILNLFNKK